jgi:hypothetical protein
MILNNFFLTRNPQAVVVSDIRKKVAKNSRRTSVSLQRILSVILRP